MQPRRAALPQELLDLIVDALWDDYPALLLCNATARRLRARARFHLYRSTVVGDVRGICQEAASGHLRLTYADLTPAPSGPAWHLIKHIELAVFLGNEVQWLALIDAMKHPACRLVSLESLVLMGDAGDIPSHLLWSYIDALHQCCSSITYLDLEHSCECHLSMLAYLIAGFPALQHVVMPSHIIPEDPKHALAAHLEDETLQPPKDLSSLSVTVLESRDLQLADSLCRLLRCEGVKRMLFVDSFFLPELLSPLSELPLQTRARITAVVSDTKWENCGIVQLLDTYPSLQFLCITVKLDATYFNVTLPQRCTLVGLCLNLIHSMELRPGALKYLTLAISIPARLALRCIDYMGLEELCEALCAPYARHMRIIIMFMLETGENVNKAARRESSCLTASVERDVRRVLAERLKQLDAPKRWACIVERDDGRGDRDWRDMRGPPMQRLIRRCVSGTFVI